MGGPCLMQSVDGSMRKQEGNALTLPKRRPAIEVRTSSINRSFYIAALALNRYGSGLRPWQLVHWRELLCLLSPRRQNLKDFLRG